MKNRLYCPNFSQFFSLFHFWCFCLIFHPPPVVLGYCQPGCQCMDDRERPEAICSGLQGIPISLNPALRRLVIQNASLTESTPFRLHPYAMAIYTELEELDLSWNGLAQLHPDVFKPLSKKLRSLSLRGNRINSVEYSGGGSAFAGLKQLEFLDLSENRLTEFPEYLLAEVPSLRELSLASNRITKISPTRRDIYNYPKEPHKNLSALDLSNNFIEYIDINAKFFDGFAQLKSLNLSKNDITNSVLHSLTKSSSLRENLQVLDLSQNPIQELRKTDFDGFRVLRKLHVKSLGFIRTIESSDVWRRLSVFALEGNRLNCTCATLAFLPTLKAAKVLRTKTNAPICESPTAFLGMNILSLKPGQPEYPLVEAMCPELRQDSEGTSASASTPQEPFKTEDVVSMSNESYGAISKESANINSLNPSDQEHEESEEVEQAEGDSDESISTSPLFFTVVGAGILLTTILCGFCCTHCFRRRKRRMALRHFRTTTVMQQEYGGGGGGGGGLFALYGRHQHYVHAYPLSSTSQEQGRCGPCFLPLCCCCLLDASSGASASTTAPSTAESSFPYPTPTTLQNNRIDGSRKQHIGQSPHGAFLQQHQHHHHHRQYRILQQQYQEVPQEGRFFAQRQQQQPHLYTTGSDLYTDSLIYSGGDDNNDHGPTAPSKYYTFTRPQQKQQHHMNQGCNSYKESKWTPSNVNGNDKSNNEKSTKSPETAIENFNVDGNSLQQELQNHCEHLRNGHQEFNGCCLPNTSTVSSASSSSASSASSSVAAFNVPFEQQQTVSSRANFLSQRQCSGSTPSGKQQMNHHFPPAQSCFSKDGHDPQVVHQNVCDGQLVVKTTNCDYCNHSAAAARSETSNNCWRKPSCTESGSCCCCYQYYSSIPPPQNNLPGDLGGEENEDDSPLSGYSCSCSAAGTPGDAAHRLQNMDQGLFPFPRRPLRGEEPQKIQRLPPAFPPPPPPPPHHQHHLVDLSPILQQYD